MPRKPKPAHELTTDEALRRVFGRTGAAQAKKLAKAPEKKSAPGAKAQVKSITMILRTEAGVDHDLPSQPVAHLVQVDLPKGALADARVVGSE
jgi:hypothetical protein